MKKAGLTVLLTVMIVTMAVGAEEEAVVPGQDYIIGPGDVLDISVWKVEELTKLVTVLPDGKIAFPLVKQVIAAGKTVDQLSQELEAKLTRYVPDLNLSVLVHQVNSVIVYVIGKVNGPGHFILNSNVDVLQALAMAGGLTPFADTNDIRIFRKEGNGTEIISFDYNAVTKGKDTAQNIPLQRGDIIVVP